MDQEQVELARTAYEYQYTISSVSSDLSRPRSAAKKLLNHTNYTVKEKI